MVAEAGVEPATFGLWGRLATIASTPQYLATSDGFGPSEYTIQSRGPYRLATR